MGISPVTERSTAMCLAFPAPVEELHPETREVTVNLGGIKRRVSAELLVDQPRVGEYVIVHTGFALAILDTAEAAATLHLMANPEERRLSA